MRLARAKLAEADHILVAACAAVAFAACSGGSAKVAPSRPAAIAKRCAPGGAIRGDVVLESREDVAALSGCREVTGDLTVGGAVADLDALTQLESVGGDVRIGHGFTLTSTAGLSGLKAVGGDLELAGNQLLSGVYLPALIHVGGSLEIDQNRNAGIVSAQSLEVVGGDVTVTGNETLWRFDLSALSSIGGTFELSDNRALEHLMIARLRDVSRVIIEDNPALDVSFVTQLRGQAHAK